MSKPSILRPEFKRLYRTPRQNIRNALDQKCLQCITPHCQKSDFTHQWLQRIEQCEKYKCALYKNRPITNKTLECLTSFQRKDHV